MPDKEYPLLTDDYVAGLLSQEATDCSTRYSALGLDAYKSSKRPTNQPKPNTRFLNNIIRDTNSHNRALLAKESAESQARLRELERAEREKQREQERLQRRARPGPADTRKRILGDIAAFISTGTERPQRKRRESDRDKGAEKKSRGRDERERSPRRSSGDAKYGEHGCGQTNHELFEGSSGSRASGRLKSDKTHDEDDRGSARRRYRDRSEDDTERHHKRISRHERDRDSDKTSARHSKSSRHDSERERERHHRTRPRSKSPSRHKRSAQASSSKRPPETEDDIDMHSDSDPLDDLIGPAPPHTAEPVQARGRGAHASSSGIDGRFAADYDPTLDIGPEFVPGPDSGNWEDTVEAYRDRQKWRQQGAERLRGAGYTEDEIKRWETGDKKDETDVRWTEKGAVREWDRGKVVDNDRDRKSVV